MNIFVYGDSNTWGYVPTLDLYDGVDSHTKRYDEKDRWYFPLNKNNRLYVSGNNGRTINNDHPLYEGKNSMKTILNDMPDDKIDLTIIMLGTNDLKECYKLSTIDLINNMNKLTSTIYNKFKCKFMLICPPYILDTVVTKVNYINGISKIDEYELALKEYTKKSGFLFVSGKDLSVGVDGEHLTIDGHKELGKRVLKVIKNIKGV